MMIFWYCVFESKLELIVVDLFFLKKELYWILFILFLNLGLVLIIIFLYLFFFFKVLLVFFSLLNE